MPSQLEKGHSKNYKNLSNLLSRMMSDIGRYNSVVYMDNIFINKLIDFLQDQRKKIIETLDNSMKNNDFQDYREWFYSKESLIDTQKRLLEYKSSISKIKKLNS